jgi:hypothetical protein
MRFRGGHGGVLGHPSGVLTGRRQRSVLDGFTGKAHVPTRYLELLIFRAQPFELHAEQLAGGGGGLAAHLRAGRPTNVPPEGRANCRQGLFGGPFQDASKCLARGGTHELSDRPSRTLQEPSHKAIELCFMGDVEHLTREFHLLRFAKYRLALALPGGFCFAKLEIFRLERTSGEQFTVGLGL